jgi:general secretion pathway protein L
MGIGEFFSWWRAELAGMLPDAWQRRFERRQHTLLLTLDGDELRVERADHGRFEELGRVDTTLPDAGERLAAMLSELKAESTRVEVSVPSKKMLMKQIQLPLAAEENLHQVLGFEMQRQTPFRAEQVYYNYRVRARRPETQKLIVQLFVVPRMVVAQALDLVADWDLVPAPAESDSSRSDGNFTFVPGDIVRRPSSRLNHGLLALNLVLLGCVIAIPLVQQQRNVEILRARLDEIRTAAASAVELRERIDAHVARAQYLFGHKAEQPTSVELLEELSQRLPDHTWLFRAEIRDGSVHLQGMSTRASALIAELEDSDYFKDVHFASPVTQDGATGRERFHLSASVVMRAGPTAGENPEGSES